MKALFVTTVALAIASCGDNSVQPAVCGDLVCDSSEDATSCADDCGCGNGVVNPGEDCDGSDVGGATCESAVQRGGTLACNADCTFDVSRCDEYMCGNGIAEPGEECDGDDVAGTTCESAGFSAGTVDCTSSCRLDLAACCNSFCDAPDTSTCAGDSVETCTMMPNGCLALEVTDCSATDLVCDDSGGTATCTCVDRCQAVGVGRCIATVAQSCAMQTTGCLDWETTFDCATTNQTCAIGPNGATCASPASGEDCFNTYTLTTGQNLIAWTASTVEYFTDQPSCGSGTLTGPDLVLSYTATVDGLASYSIAKEESMRHVTVVTDAACGTITPAAEVACSLDTDNTSMSASFPVSAGTTYYFYVRDTTTGSAGLPNPLLLDLDEAACAGLVNTPSNLTPANGTSVVTPSPIISFDLQYPLDPSTGSITITGDQGTSITYDLATDPSEVTISNGARSVRIDPPDFMPGETLTVSWSGLVGSVCGAAIAPPAWTFSLAAPSCTPGVGGMVGRTVTRRETGLSSLTEQYVTVDPDPNGYVYFGGQTELYRTPKAGGTVENVVSAAVIGSSQLGYAVAIVGARIFSLDTTTVSTSSFLWRLSTSGGVTWSPLGYGRYPVTAGGSAKAMVHHGGRLYMITDETTAGAATEIWSVSATANQLPELAVREATLPGRIDCDGLAMDNDYYYMACDDDDNAVVRVHRTTLQIELITDAFPLNLTKNELHVDDFDGDGLADVLYVKSDNEAVYYVCGPSGTGPFWHDLLVTFGSTTVTANYGLGFDPVANVLWAFDDDDRDLVLIQ